MLNAIIGHPGMDWGSGAPLAGYHYGYDYAIALT